MCEFTICTWFCLDFASFSYSESMIFCSLQLLPWKEIQSCQLMAAMILQVASYNMLYMCFCPMRDKCAYLHFVLEYHWTCRGLTLAADPCAKIQWAFKNQDANVLECKLIISLPEKAANKPPCVTFLINSVDYFNNLRKPENRN